ncbi:hypothetical protein LIER_36785 [Lithospermum erythrorhizon]|uniref:Uncharacterized protein n=1 Tax=Lithospermum erythrorhizon TaxID=34254 RepID=A0AAV3PFC0_LITER
MGTLQPQENMPIHRQGFHLMKKKRDRATQTSIRRRTEYNDDDGDSMTTRKRKRPYSPKRRVRKESVGSALTEIISAFVESSTKRSELLTQKLLANCESSCEPRTETPTIDEDALLMESISALDAFEDIEDSQYLKALKLLREDPIWKKIFLNIPLNRKRGVVLIL